MTEKHWFIFRGDHHLGPFSFNEILEKVKLSQIQDDELTWCEGNQDWLPVMEQPAIKQALGKEKLEDDILLEREREEELLLERLAQEKLMEADRKREAELQVLEEEKRQRELRERQQKEQERLELEALRKLEEEMRLKKQLKKLQEEEVPPPLPPLPMEEGEEPEELEDGDESPYYEEESFDLDSEDADIEDFEEDEQEKGSEFFLSEEEEEAPRSNLRVYGGIIGTVIGLAILGLALSDIFPHKRKLHDVSGRDRDALYGVMNRAYKGKAIHRLRPSKDFNSLWLATNFPHDAEVYLSLKTIPGRFLGAEMVELQAKALLRGGAAYFDEIEVLKGESLVVGEYEYNVKGSPMGIWEKLSQDKGKLSFKGTLLISPNSKDVFEHELSQHKQRLEKTVIQPIKNRLQRYTTYIGLIEKLRELYQGTLKRITKGKSIFIFENEYNKQIGPILRDLIIDDNRLSVSLFNLKPDESKAYEDSMNFGKDIGIVASDMVTKTRRFKKIDRKRTESLIETFDRELNKLLELGASRKKLLENELSPYKE